jgi:hypothetical protein
MDTHANLRILADPKLRLLRAKTFRILHWTRRFACVSRVGVGVRATVVTSELPRSDCFPISLRQP